MEENPVNANTWKTEMIELGPKAYAYIQAFGSAGISNAGLILGRDRAFIVDALATTQMASQFLGQIRSLTSLPISHILLTHHHVDHFLGTQNFLPAQVVCHVRCRDEMVRNGATAVERWAGRHPQFPDALRGVRICMPDQTFNDRICFYLDDTEVQFFHLGMGHTQGDGLVYLRRQKLLFAGDVAFHKVTPQGFQGHIGNWIRIVERILEMDVETVVPGHGPVGNKADLGEMRDYLKLVYDHARQCFDQGLSEAQAVATFNPGPFFDWCESGRIRDNIERAYREFRGEIPAD